MPGLVHLFIVFLATGLWHGAAWGFVLWGLWHGMFCILERVAGNLHNDKGHGGKNAIYYVRNVFSHVYTLLVVITGWVLFNLVSVRGALSYVKVMFGITRNSFTAYSPSYYMDGRTTVLMAVSVLACLPWKAILRLKESTGLLIVKRLILLILLALCFVFIITSTYNPFIYFRF